MYLNVYIYIQAPTNIYVELNFHRLDRERRQRIRICRTTGIMHLDIIMALLVRLRGSRNILSHPQSGRHLRLIFEKKPFPGTLFGVSVFPISAQGTACTHYTEFMPTVYYIIYIYI